METPELSKDALCGGSGVRESGKMCPEVALLREGCRTNTIAGEPGQGKRHQGRRTRNHIGEQCGIDALNYLALTTGCARNSVPNETTFFHDIFR
jgi:hypothetical protein